MKLVFRMAVTGIALLTLLTAPPARAVNPVTVVPVGYKITTNFGDAVATSVQGNGSVATTLADPRNGSVLATLKWDQGGNSLVWDVAGVGTTTESLDDNLPSLTGSNYAIYYIYKNTLVALRQQGVRITGDAPGVGTLDNPGCDWFPDPLETPCVRACCDTHDACYAAQSPPCTWKSWLPFVGTRACKECNKAVVKCIAKCVKDAIIGKLPQPIEQR